MYLGGYRNNQYSGDLTWNKSFGASLEHPINVSVAATFRQERYEIKAGEPASYRRGALILDGPNEGNLAPPAGGLTLQDQGSAKRVTQGVGINIEKRLLDPVLLGIAGRFDHYSDFGSRPTGKVWGSVDIVPEVLVRGSVGTGYRAPTLGQIRYSTTGFVADNQLGDFVQSRGLPVESPIARALGATPLKPETSTSFTFGAKWEPAEHAELSVDVYQIEIDDRITLSENLTGPFVGNVLGEAGFPEVRIASFFLNALDTRTRGVDLAGRYRFGLGERGDLDLGFAFSAFNTKITKKAQRPDQLNGSDLVLTSRRVEGLYTSASPENKFVATVRYQIAGFDVLLTQKRYGSYSEIHPFNPEFDQRYSPQFITDIVATYGLENGLRFTLGVNNLFDSRPDEQRKELSVGGFGMSRYSDLAPEGMDGTYYFGRVAYQF